MDNLKSELKSSLFPVLTQPGNSHLSWGVIWKGGDVICLWGSQILRKYLNHTEYC